MQHEAGWRKHRVGRAHALHVLATTTPIRYPATDDLDPRLEWVGDDDRGLELEVIAVELPRPVAGHPRHADRIQEEPVTEHFLSAPDVDLDAEDVREGHGRRITVDYVGRGHRRAPAATAGPAVAGWAVALAHREVTQRLAAACR